MLIDTFMFYNELDVLELRLTLLDEWVDSFVLVEAEVNHAGGPKELFFQNNRERFAKWNHKIKHVIVTAEEAPKDENPWAREKYQRECIKRGLGDVPHNAIVMISDVDEIPDMTKIPIEKLPNVVVSIHMWMFMYSLDHIIKNEPWFGTVITNCELLWTWGPNYFRDNRWKFFPMQYCGWHLSSFGDGYHVANKMNTFAHSKDPHEIEWSGPVLQDLIDKGIWADGKTKLLLRPPEVPLPGHVEVLRRLRLGTFPETAPST
jgi:beta-1,4-mannosyl-glycoprotein beta-1,4-N-acetylglucosaminyltransferase